MTEHKIMVTDKSGRSHMVVILQGNPIASTPANLRDMRKVGEEKGYFSLAHEDFVRLESGIIRSDAIDVVGEHYNFIPTTELWKLRKVGMRTVWLTRADCKTFSSVRYEESISGLDLLEDGSAGLIWKYTKDLFSSDETGFIFIGK